MAKIQGAGLQEWSFLVPECTNSGKQLHAAGAWNWLHNELERFGGFTGPEGPVPGQEGATRDRSYRYYVAIRPEKASELCDLLTQACLVFDQERIYLRGPGNEVMMISP